MGKGIHQGNLNKRDRRNQREDQESEWQEYDKGRIRFEPFVPATEKQDELRCAIENAELVIAVGPAGTGKSYVEAACAIAALAAKTHDGIILTRNPLPTGQTTGFNPGTIEEKLLPWLSPILSNIQKAARTDKGNNGFFKYLMDKKQITMQELESIKGSSFDDKVLIMEECQEMTLEQLKNVTTRGGNNTKIILNGDIAQGNDRLKTKDFLKFIEAVEAHNADLERRIVEDPDSVEPWDQYIPVIRFDKEDCIRSGLCRLMLEIFEENGWC